MADFYRYIRLQLGEEVNVVEITDNQLATCIGDSIDYAQQYGLYDSQYEDYVQIFLSAGVSSYNLSGVADDVISVVFLDAGLSNLGGPSILFSPINLLFNGANPVTAYGIGSLALTQFEVFSQYLSLVNKMFAIEFRLNYNQYSKEMKVVPTPVENMVAVVKVYRKTAAEFLFNHPLIKNLAVAKAKKIWSRSLMKYGSSIDLPGRGNTFAFGESLLIEGREEERDYQRMIRSEPGEIVGFIMG